MTILDFKQGAQAQSAKASGAVIEVDERSFQKEVVERSQTTTVVIDFWAPWCGPCRTLGPMLEKLAGEAKGAWVLAKVNVDNNQRLAQAFGIQGIPAVKAVRDGRLVDEFTGALPESQIRAWLKRVVPTEVGPAAEAAEDLPALEASDPQAAIRHYEKTLKDNPEDDATRLALGRMAYLARDPQAAGILREIKAGSPSYQAAQAWLTLAELTSDLDESDAFELLGRVDSGPADLEARYQLAAHQIAGQRYADAIDQLLEIVARNRGFREDGARKILLAVFAALGDQEALAQAGRKRLANLLF
jgi:putative thioredoxin